jgi:hypothetical protein
MKGLSSEQYFKILGVDINASLDQVKKAYRKKARLYHPDLNKKKEAAELFIIINEAYEYLLDYIESGRKADDARAKLVKEWQEYRRQEARKRAYKYSKEKYIEFTRSNTYKTSMVLNKVQLFINLSVAVFIISMAIIGYVIKWQMVDKGADPPTLITFLSLLSIGVIFLLVSLAHLKAFIKNTRKSNLNETKNK